VRRRSGIQESFREVPPMRIGVISDTHNYFDPQIPKIFEGVSHILHAGDIGLSVILGHLEEIAPVTAVSGNTDDPGFRYPLTQIVELSGRKFLLHHILAPHSPEDSIRQRIAREQPQIVVFGHTHKPFSENIRGTLYLNPGYAGKSRFGMPRSVAILHCSARSLRSEVVLL
jgi:uncharacterized protein